MFGGLRFVRQSQGCQESGGDSAKGDSPAIPEPRASGWWATITLCRSRSRSPAAESPYRAAASGDTTEFDFVGQVTDAKIRQPSTGHAWRPQALLHVHCVLALQIFGQKLVDEVQERGVAEEEVG